MGASRRRHRRNTGHHHPRKMHRHYRLPRLRPHLNATAMPADNTLTHREPKTARIVIGPSRKIGLKNTRHILRRNPPAIVNHFKCRRGLASASIDKNSQHNIPRPAPRNRLLRIAHQIVQQPTDLRRIPLGLS